MKADQAKAKAEAAAAKAAASAHQQSQKNQVAALEDARQVEEYTRSLEDLRLDLHIDHKSASNTDVDTLSDSHLILDDPTGLPREPLIDTLLDHRSYGESTHSKDFLTGWGSWKEQENSAERVGDNEDDQDQDYVMQSKSEASEASQDEQTQRHKSGPSAPCPKAKFKPQRKVCFV